MKRVKKRKPRTTGDSLRFDGAHQFGKETIFMSDSPAWNKLFRRMRAGLCLGCGKKPCECKSKKDLTKV